MATTSTSVETKQRRTAKWWSKEAEEHHKWLLAVCAPRSRKFYLIYLPVVVPPAPTVPAVEPFLWVPLPAVHSTPLAAVPEFQFHYSTWPASQFVVSVPPPSRRRAPSSASPLWRCHSNRAPHWRILTVRCQRWKFVSSFPGQWLSVMNIEKKDGN